MTRQVKWAILFTPFEHEDTEYVKEGCGSIWTDKSPVKVFDTYEDAVAEQKNWNTGIIVEYTDDRQYKNSIREMTDDERLRAMHRSKMNKRTNS